MARPLELLAGEACTPAALSFKRGSKGLPGAPSPALHACSSAAPPCPCSPRNSRPPSRSFACPELYACQLHRRPHLAPRYASCGGPGQRIALRRAMQGAGAQTGTHLFGVMRLPVVVAARPPELRLLALDPGVLPPQLAQVVGRVAHALAQRVQPAAPAGGPGRPDWGEPSPWGTRGEAGGLTLSLCRRGATSEGFARLKEQSLAHRPLAPPLFAREPANRPPPLGWPNSGSRPHPPEQAESLQRRH